MGLISFAGLSRSDVDVRNGQRCFSGWRCLRVSAETSVSPRNAKVTRSCHLTLVPLQWFVVWSLSDTTTAALRLAVSRRVNDSTWSWSRSKSTRGRIRVCIVQWRLRSRRSTDNTLSASVHITAVIGSVLSLPLVGWAHNQIWISAESFSAVAAMVATSLATTMWKSVPDRSRYQSRVQQTICTVCTWVVYFIQY